MTNDVIQAVVITGKYAVPSSTREKCNSLTGCVFTLHPFFFLGTADRPGLAALQGQVGHHGVFGCWEYCGLRGRHKPGGPHYYPALCRPLNYDLPECSHNDVDVFRLPTAARRLYILNLDQVLNPSGKSVVSSRFPSFVFDSDSSNRKFLFCVPYSR